MAFSASTLLPFMAGLRLMVRSLLIQPNRIDPAGWGATTQCELSPSEMLTMLPEARCQLFKLYPVTMLDRIQDEAHSITKHISSER